MSKTDSQLVGQLYDHVRQLCGLCAVLRLAQNVTEPGPGPTQHGVGIPGLSGNIGAEHGPIGGRPGGCAGQTDFGG